MGFRPFVNINPKKRDDKVRLVWDGILDDRIITIIIITTPAIQVENIMWDNNREVLKKIFDDPFNMEKVFNFIKSGISKSDNI